jgi:hypothetical protein
VRGWKNPGGDIERVLPHTKTQRNKKRKISKRFINLNSIYNTEHNTIYNIITLTYINQSYFDITLHHYKKRSNEYHFSPIT